MRDKQQKQRDKANKRWQKPADEPGIPAALPQHNDSDAVALIGDADAMPPTPTPTPTPISTPNGVDRASKSRPPRSDSTLSQFLATCKAEGVKPIRPDHPIRQWCRDAGVSDEMLQVAWVLFRRRFADEPAYAKQRQKDWPAHFANAVRGNWFKVWYVSETEGVKWASVGMAEKSVLEARASQHEAAEHAEAEPA